MPAETANINAGTFDNRNFAAAEISCIESRICSAVGTRVRSARTLPRLARVESKVGCDVTRNYKYKWTSANASILLTRLGSASYLAEASAHDCTPNERDT